MILWVVTCVMIVTLPLLLLCLLDLLLMFVVVIVQLVPNVLGQLINVNVKVQDTVQAL